MADGQSKGMTPGGCISLVAVILLMGTLYWIGDITGFNNWVASFGDQPLK